MPTTQSEKTAKDNVKDWISHNVTKDDLETLIGKIISDNSSFTFTTSSIADPIYHIDDKKLSTLNGNMKRFEEILDGGYANRVEIDTESNKICRKFLNHIELSLVQREFILGNLRDRKKALAEIKDQRARIYGDFIAILGIFSALIFGLFGGFDQLSSVVNSSVQNGITKTLIFGSLISFMLIMLIFLLVHSIGMLTGKKLMACGCDNTSECSHSFFKRYPIFSTNILLCSIIFFLGIVFHLYLGKNLINNFKVWDFRSWNLYHLTADYQFFAITVILLFAVITITFITGHLLFSKNKISN
ncbi:hypothetical protein EQI52_09095 [Leuconostoc mesenteroides]|uniref:hypothetical protein n=1 Tax=Leuconostoc mesenteroides TaxID=1245 RepID=UPI000FFCC99E|nr:hypothetical protein [Leuconostoc mesenteroides]QAR69946.1 hypothetical protein EQI52_09095 [Leuconostoc mesenteroides]